MVQGGGQMFVKARQPFFMPDTLQVIAGIGFSLIYDRASTSLFY